MALYSTTAKIVIDLSERKLAVYRKGVLVRTFSVAVGRPRSRTPTGHFYLTQKLRPPDPTVCTAPCNSAPAPSSPS